MPNKPLRPCSYPGCPKLTSGKYCDEHRKRRDSEYSKFNRDKESVSFYKSKEWKELRNYFLSKHPLCMECLKANKLVPARIVDHIVPIKKGGAALDPSNLQSLCWSCHTTKSNNEGSSGFKKKS